MPFPGFLVLRWLLLAYPAPAQSSNHACQGLQNVGARSCPSSRQPLSNWDPGPQYAVPVPGLVVHFGVPNVCHRTWDLKSRYPSLKKYPNTYFQRFTKYTNIEIHPSQDIQEQMPSLFSQNKEIQIPDISIVRVFPGEIRRTHQESMRNSSQTCSTTPFAKDERIHKLQKHTLTHLFFYPQGGGGGMRRSLRHCSLKLNSRRRPLWSTDWANEYRTYACE